MGGYLMSIIQAGNTTTTSLIYTGDTTGNLVFTTGGANTTALTLSNTQAATFAGSVNTPNTFGFKNRIINGGMVIDQRNAAASQTFTAAAALAYSVDRWYGYCTGANVTGQQVAGAATPTVAQYRYKFTGLASVTAVGFGQRIEQKNCYDLAGSTCTLSADLASSSLNTVTWTASYANTADTFGSLASPTITLISTGTFTITSTVTNYSVNISVPAAATTGIQIVFTVGALLGSDTWTIGNVQFEVGSQATSFDLRDSGTELMLCRRYYQYYPYVTGFTAQPASSSTYVATSLSFNVPMRTSPTPTFTAPSGGSTGNIEQWGGTTRAVNSYNIGNSNLQFVALGSGVTTGDVFDFHLTLNVEL
jgi:hypothetical protein